jgi:hypothetical protein
LNEDKSASLWALAYQTLRPKKSDPTPNACLNRLVNERLTGVSTIQVNEKTAAIREEIWPTEQLSVLERKHKKKIENEDNRPIVVVEMRDRKLLIDGNHRVNRWLSTGKHGQHRVLLITLR